MATVDAEQPPDRSSASRHTIPSLDGLRGAAIVTIVLVHAIGTRGMPLKTSWLTSAQNLGRAFLYIFLCQSGYLITRILLREKLHAGGRISIHRFYLRRAFRIFPAYGTYLLTIGILGVIGLQSVPASSLAHAATYTVNYVQERSVLTGHFWTLAIEEQFYLLWPLLLSVLSTRKAMRVLALAIVAAPILHGLAYIPPATRNQSAYFFTSAMDVMGWGCLLALVEKDSAFDRIRQVLSGVPVLIGAIVLAVGTYQLPGAHGTFQHAGLGTILFLPSLAVLSLVLVLRYSTRPTLPVGRVLNWRPIAWLGEISYSVYLWHILFANRYEHGFASQFPLNVFLSFAVGATSYTLIEKPTRRLRDRWVPAPKARSPRTPE